MSVRKPGNSRKSGRSIATEIWRRSGLANGDPCPDRIDRRQHAAEEKRSPRSFPGPRQFGILRPAADGWLRVAAKVGRRQDSEACCALPLSVDNTVAIRRPYRIVEFDKESRIGIGSGSRTLSAASKEIRAAHMAAELQLSTMLRLSSDSVLLASGFRSIGDRRAATQRPGGLCLCCERGY